jgi:3-hydroxyacyl-[acyl-carrier-protein] dehydratase
VKNIDSHSELLFSVPTNHACYADHFPDNPLVPGALLLKWVLGQIENKYHCKVSLLKSVKFLAPIKPGDELKITVNTDPLKLPLSFTIYVLNTLVIKGSIACESYAHPYREQQ